MKIKAANDKKLNKEQIEAVMHREGPLVIIAGAGTGKTTVVTERIKWVINEKLALPHEILALTFTDKAAREMEKRVDIALPYGYTQMWIMTFHSFGERVLRQDAVNIGLDPGYRLMTTGESVILFRKNLFNFELDYFRPLGNPFKFIQGMLSHFSRLKDEDITPEQYLHWARAKVTKAAKADEDEKITGRKYMELAHAFKTYEDLKVKAGVMDFGDLIANTLMLFRTRKNILKEYQGQFKYILIDEFQDTNYAQNELAVLLAGAGKNITVVGDDDQAIYRFRGAAVSNILQFRKTFPRSKLVVLTDNYRSTQEILDKSHQLIEHNNPDRLEAKEKIVKKLHSVREVKGSDIELIYEDRVEQEADKTIKKIKELKAAKDLQNEEIYAWKDFAILLRANVQSEPFVRALERAGIPFQFLGPGMLFRQPEVKDLIAYLKILNNFDDSVAMYRVLSMDGFELDSRDLSGVTIFARKVGISLFEACEVIVSKRTNEPDHWSKGKNYEQYLPRISPKSAETLTSFVHMILRHLKLAKKETAGQLLYYFLEDSGLLKRLAVYKSVRDEQKALNISKFFDKLKSFETDHEDASVSAVTDWIEMSSELGESPLAVDMDWGENDAVNVLTVHSSKGLEFANVFLVNLVTNRFPTSLRREQIPIPDELVKEILPQGDFHMEEERRLFYVGMTRAKDNLFFTAANFYGEGKRERKISPFVLDTLGTGMLLLKPVAEKKAKQLTLLEWKKSEEREMRQVRPFTDYLSYSQIATFLTCPLQYKYRYIVKIPVPPTAAGSFGTSIHATLERFYQEKIEGKNPSKNDLIKMFDKVWLPVGYGTKEYEEKMKKRGIKMLTNFFTSVYNPKIIPKHLEQVFNIKLTPDLTIGGKIDRVDELAGGKIEIIDYKTGKRPPQKAINDSLQMNVYALAATDKGIFNMRPEKVILSFYFLDQGEKVSISRSVPELEEAKRKIIETAENIRRSSFEPKVGTWCDFCDFRLICEAWQ